MADLLETTWQWLQADLDARRVLTLGDPHYPVCPFGEWKVHPIDAVRLGVLRGCGQATVWRSQPNSLAVGWTTQPAPTQGASNAHQFSQALAQAGFTIVSGLALGVDGTSPRRRLSTVPPPDKSLPWPRRGYPAWTGSIRSNTGFGIAQRGLIHRRATRHYPCRASPSATASLPG